MSKIIAISLDSNIFGGYLAKATNDQLAALEPLSHINIIVGSNNSGKSRFMRLLSSQKTYRILTDDTSIEDANRGLRESLEQIKVTFTNYGYIEINQIQLQEVQNKLNSLPDALQSDTDVYRDYRVDLRSWANLQRITRSTTGSQRIFHPDESKVVSNIATAASEALSILDAIPERSSTNHPKRVYIPILRGLRALDDNHTDFYEQRTRNDYFNFAQAGTKEREAPEIFTGIKFYDRLMELLLGNNQKRKVIENYQKFISKTFFEGQEVVLIPDRDAKVVTVKIGDETDQPIYLLGEGVQAAIILSFLPFITKESCFFFIEEPEMHMHPGLQRKVIDFMASPVCKQHVFFLTCHSNHLLDLTIDLKDVSVFTFRKQLEEGGGDEQLARVTVEAIDSSHHSSLELLGVRNSSVFLVNSTIWVEGITDRLYLRAFLKGYIDYEVQQRKENPDYAIDEFFKPEEDVHYCFVEYGGANIVHWSFLESDKPVTEVERLCGRALVIADNDDGGKEERHTKIRQKIGDRLIVLDRREVENILPPEVIRGVIAQYEGTLLEQVPDFTFEQYEKEYLGEFIDQVFVSSKKERKRATSYSSKKVDAEGNVKGTKTGTITDKVRFCDRALDVLEGLPFFEWPDATKELAVRMYEFIKSHN